MFFSCMFLQTPLCLELQEGCFNPLKQSFSHKNKVMFPLAKTMSAQECALCEVK